MNKLAKLAKVVRTLARNPKRIGNVLLDPYEFDIRRRMAAEYGMPRGLPTIDLLDLAPQLDETVDPFCFNNSSSRPVDLAFLKAFAAGRWASGRYLEIGTLRGESIVNISPAFRECVSLTLSAEEILERGGDANHIKNNGLFLTNIQNVKQIGHDSQTFDFSSIGKFDLVFVDGDHSYEAVRQDTRNVFSTLRDERSVIIWHDYGFEYDTPRWSVMAGILDGAPAEMRSRIYHVSNTLCAIYINGNFRTEFQDEIPLPKNVFTVRVSARRL